MPPLTAANPPIDELGVLLEADTLLARSDEGAVLLTGLRAYSTGLRVGLAFVLREAEVGLWPQVVGSSTQGGPRVGFAHGSEAVVMTALIEPQLSTHPSWTLINAGGGDRRYDIELWTSPLPGNELYLHYRWPDYGIQQSVNQFACPRVTRRGIWDGH